MYTYEINVAIDGSHHSLIKLHVHSEEEAKDALAIYRTALGSVCEGFIALTLYRVPAQSRQQVEA